MVICRNRNSLVGDLVPQVPDFSSRFSFTRARSKETHTPSTCQGSCMGVRIPQGLRVNLTERSQLEFRAFDLLLELHVEIDRSAQGCQEDPFR